MDRSRGCRIPYVPGQPRQPDDAATDDGQAELLLTRREGSVSRLSKATNKWVISGETKRFPVYLFRPESNTWDAVPWETWDSAAGDVVECDYDDLSAVQVFVNPEKYRLEILGRPIATVTRLAVGARLSRSGRFVAVLSAEERSVSWMPFFSGGGATGQHSHQILDATNRVYQQGVVRIPLVTEGGLQSCWSPDDRYIVYYNGSEVSIVPFDATADTAKRQ